MLREPADVFFDLQREHALAAVDPRLDGLTGSDAIALVPGSLRGLEDTLEEMVGCEWRTKSSRTLALGVPRPKTATHISSSTLNASTNHGHQYLPADLDRGSARIRGVETKRDLDCNYTLFYDKTDGKCTPGWS